MGGTLTFADIYGYGGAPSSQQQVNPKAERGGGGLVALAERTGDMASGITGLEVPMLLGLGLLGFALLYYF